MQEKVVKKKVVKKKATKKKVVKKKVVRKRVEKPTASVIKDCQSNDYTPENSSQTTWERILMGILKLLLYFVEVITKSQKRRSLRRRMDRKD